MEVKMNISPVANNLIIAFNNYIEESNKKDYRFTYEEQIKLEQLIKVLNNQIDMLIQYELKRED